MLDPPSRRSALILFCRHQLLRLLRRARRALRAVIGLTSAGHRLERRRGRDAGRRCVAGACALTRACPAEAAGEGGLHAAAPMPMPAAAPECTKLRREIFMASILQVQRVQRVQRCNGCTGAAVQPAARRTRRTAAPVAPALAVLDERAVLELGVRLLKLRLRVHHDRPVPRHRLFERAARHQQEANALRRPRSP